MKKILLITATVLGSFITKAQDITNTLGSDGTYTVESSDGTHVPLVVNSIGQVGLSMNRAQRDNDTLSSSVNFYGSLTVPIRTINSTSGNLTDNDYLIYVKNPNGTDPSTVTLQMPDANAAKGRIYTIFREINVKLILHNNTDVVFDNNSTLYTIVNSDGIEWHAHSVASSNEDINPGYIVNIEKVTGEFTISGPEIQLYHVYGSKQATVDLPSAKDVKGVVYTVTLIEDNNSGGTLEINPPGGELINGQSSGSVTNVLYVFIYSDGENWWAFGNRGDAARTLVPDSFSSNATIETSSSNQLFEANITDNNQSYILTLPSALEKEDITITIKRNANGVVRSNNVVKIKPSGSDKIDSIDSSSSYDLANDFESVTLKSNGTIWMIINQVNH